MAQPKIKDGALEQTNLDAGSVGGFVLGTSANNILQLNSSSQIPAVDGSLLTNLPPSGLINIVEDLSPQLGGNLDVLTRSIITTTVNGNITLTPNGVGNVVLGNFTFDGDQTVGAGQDNYVLTYDNATGNVSLELASGGYIPLSINTLTLSNVTLSIGDEGNMVYMNRSSAQNLTVPPNSSVAFAIGAEIVVAQQGVGQTTFVQGAGVTINSAGGLLSLASQYSSATLIKTATNTWLLSGDII